MFESLFRFELRGHLRRPTTWLYFAVLFLLTFGILSSDAISIAGALGKVKKNSPFALTRAYVALVVVGQVITSALVGTSILRDFELRVHELLFTTRMTRRGYLAAKFLAAFIAMLLVYTAIPLGAIAGTLMPWVDRETLLPVHLWFYIQPMFTVVLPTVFFISALFFAVGAVTRNQFAIYTTGILLLVGISIGDELIRTLDRDQLANLLDPFGFRTVDLMTRYWTVAEKNSRVIPFDSFLLTNRLVWFGISLLLVMLAFRVVRLEKEARALRRRRKAVATPPTPAHILIVPTTTRRFDGAAAWGTWWSITRFHSQSLLRSIPFLAIAAIGLINVIMSCIYADEIFGTKTWPLSWIMAETVTGAQTIFAIVLLTFYAGELVWRERQVDLDQVLDASPVQTVAVALGKMSAMAVMLLAFSITSIVGGIAVQLAKGFPHVDLPVYFVNSFIADFPNYICYIAIAFLVQTLAPRKAVGHVLMIVFYVLTIASNSLGADHMLYLPSLGSSAQYSDLNGWGVYPQRWWPLHGYWWSISILLVVLTVLYWIRGTGSGKRGTVARVRFGPRTRLLTLFGALSAAAFGGVIFYNTNVLNRYERRKTADKRSAAYERSYKHFERTPQPKVVAVNLAVDLHPSTLQASAAGAVTLVNRNNVPVDSLYIEGPGSGILKVSWDSLYLSRQSTRVISDSINGVYVLKLAEPLAPGDTMMLNWHLSYAQHGFANAGVSNVLAYNGTFMNRDQFPRIAYDGGGEIGDDDKRREQKLPPKERAFAIDDTVRQKEQAFSPGADFISFEATVSTDADQIAMAPGYLLKEWTENDRHYFHYVMDSPIPDFYSVLSARWTITRSEWNGVKIEIYHHPDHAFNVQRMIEATKASLAYYTEQFGPYQHRQVRILEFPRYATFAQSFPNTIPYSEAIGFTARVDTTSELDLDYPYFVTAHEMAHQWFPYQRMVANVQGSAMPSESMSEYAALAATEKRYGTEKLQKFLRFELDQYLTGRSGERKKEMPLMLVENQAYIHYQKGSLAFFALRDLIGEKALNGALKAYLDEGRFTGPPYATTRDVMRHLYAATPDSLQYALHDLFETITLWDFKADSATATKLPDGTWRVRLVASSLKLRADSLGGEKQIPLADYIDIGVFGEKSAGSRLGKALSVRKVKVTKPNEVFEFIVREKPVRAGIDPYNRMIDRNPGDNTRDVSGG